MAFQPIVDIEENTIFAHEALVRGPKGEGAAFVFQQVSELSRYAFDQTCRTKAIELASGLGIREQGSYLSINFLPNAVYEPKACIKATLSVAEKYQFPLDRIVFEFTEVEQINSDHLLNIMKTYHEIGFKIAIDDFGAGWSGLGLLGLFRPDIVKLDMGLIRNINDNHALRVIVKHTTAMVADLNVSLICEGIETRDEFMVLRDLGVRYMQGYFFARPCFKALSPREDWQDLLDT